MSWNISFFLENLPEDYDSWNFTSRIFHFSANLYSFNNLDNKSQTVIAQNFTRTNFVEIYKYGREFPPGLNGTVEFLKYIVDTYIYPPIPPVNPCDTIEQHEIDFTTIMGIPAVIIVALVTLFKKRKQYRLNLCWGRPGLQYPVNMIDETHRRWAFMAAFAVIAYKVLNIFEGKHFWKPDKFQDKTFTDTWGWLSVFVTLMNVILLGVIYYPLLLCVTQRKYIIMNLLGIAYFVPWIYLVVDIYQRCSPTEKNQNFRSILQLFFDIPIFVAYIALLVSYCLDLGKNLKRLYGRLTAQNKSKYIKQERRMEFFNSKSIQYLQYLFNKKPQEPPKTIFQKIKKKLTYERVQGFCYSTRILCTMTLAALFLYKFHIFLDVIARVLHGFAIEGFESIREYIVEAFVDLPEMVDYLEEAVDVVYWAFFACFTLSLILHGLFLLHMLITYKQHMGKLMKGDIRWHFKNNTSPAQHMVSGMRYSGYQIAYMFYGYFIVGSILFLVVIFLTYFVIIPLRDNLWSPVIEQFKRLWPTLIVSLALLWGQVLLAKFCFLQERGAYMALNNRRLYHIVSFYLFFFNVVLGLFSCLRRIVMSMAFGMLLISRLDRCLLMRGFERFDAGYKAYLGMLEVEIYHTHPLLRAFLMILHEQVVDTKNREMNGGVVANSLSVKVKPEYINGAMTEMKFSPSKRYDKRIVIKWWKMVTLVNNPVLIIERIEKRVKESGIEKRDKGAVIDGLVESAAIVSTGFVAVTGVAMVQGLSEVTSM